MTHDDTTRDGPRYRGIPSSRADGEAAITNWELIYQHQVHVIGLNIGVLIQAAAQIFGELMGELYALMAARCAHPRPAHHT